MGHASLIRLDADLVTSAGARCLDGSGGGFYWRAASSAQNATKLVVFLQGGGECRSATECAVWDGGAGRGSAGWPKTKRLGEDELSDDASVNPHFHDWNKLFVPYCSADMHSGTRLTPSHALGGGYFAGHNLINATLAQLRRSLPALAPSLVLLSGSSAGGIGVLLHADYFAAAWPAATVKAAPAAGFFYPAVSSERDFINGDATPARRLGPHARPAPPQLLRPAAPRGLTGVPPPHCRPRGRVGAVRLAALRRAVSGRGRNVHRPSRGRVRDMSERGPTGEASKCTDAAFAWRALATPLFVRENQYDTAKLANCGCDASAALTANDTSYLRQWGRWVRGTLRDLGSEATPHGYFAPSCLSHAANLGWSAAPLIRGVSMLDSLAALGPFPEPSLNLPRRVDARLARRVVLRDGRRAGAPRRRLRRAAVRRRRRWLVPALAAGPALARVRRKARRALPWPPRPRRRLRRVPRVSRARPRGARLPLPRQALGTFPEPSLNLPRRTAAPPAAGRSCAGTAAEAAPAGTTSATSASGPTTWLRCRRLRKRCRASRQSPSPRASRCR